MKKNFEIKDAIYLVSGPSIIDIHNDYAISNYNLIPTESGLNHLTMSFLKRTGEWVKAEAPDLFILSFFGISKFETNSETNDSLQICHIDEIGYWPSVMKLDDWLLSESDFNDNLDILFRFTDSSSIRIKALEAHLNLPSK